MWNCDKCGCKNIAASLDVCPMCFKEASMPRITSSGPSNHWELPEVLEAPETSQQPVEELSEAVQAQEPEVSEEAPEKDAEPVSDDIPPVPAPPPTVEELQAQIAQLQSQQSQVP